MRNVYIWPTNACEFTLIDTINFTINNGNYKIRLNIVFNRDVNENLKLQMFCFNC